MRPRGPKPLTAAQQLLHLRSNPTFAGESRIRQGRLTWRGCLRPTPLSRAYDLRLDYHIGRSPQVIVEGPNLRALAEGRRLPHVYEQDPARLCLYLPSTGEWRPERHEDEQEWRDMGWLDDLSWLDEPD